MLFKFVKNNFVRKKTLLIILFLFIMIASCLVSTGTIMLTQLYSSVSNLIETTAAPDIIQLHKGELNADAIIEWASSNPVVRDAQIVKMIDVESSAVYLGKTNLSEAGSVMSLDFVQQNKAFDFLLDLNGQPIHLAQGEIAVPIYFMQQNNLKTGDPVKIAHGNFDMELTIVSFARDVLMNPAIVHSKRFVLNHDDFVTLENSKFAAIQYLIEFRLNHLEMINEIGNQYQQSGLPQNGPMIDYRLLKILNSISDGIVIGIFILISFLLILVALLCLRFTILATIEEDYRQVGILKAIGIPSSFICRMHLLQYTFLAAAACLAGYLCSLACCPIFSTNIQQYLGLAPSHSSMWLIPLLGVILTFIIIVGFCGFILRGLRRVSAMSVLRQSSRENPGVPFSLFSLGTCRFLNLSILLALRDLIQRSRLFLFLCIVFFICVSIVILPLNFLNTLKSPDFIHYMGIAPSEMRIDLHQGRNPSVHLSEIVKHLENDNDVKEYAVFTTSRFKVFNDKKQTENMHIESGNFSHFPIQLLSGHSPINEDQIALSYLQSKQLEKTVGDSLRLLIEGKPKKVTISGIYQDITNGGLTAKALFQSDPSTTLWHVINVNFRSHSQSKEKMDRYRELFYPARVTNVEDYLAQTLGHLLKQVNLAVVASMLTGLGILALIASLFFRMLIAKDARKIAIMKAIGFSTKQINAQYLIQAVFVLSLSIVMATIASCILGECLIGLIWSMMGAPAITFVVSPIQVYIICPLAIMCTVLAVVWLFALKIHKPDIVGIIIE